MKQLFDCTRDGNAALCRRVPCKLRILAALLAVLMAFSVLSGCAGNQEPQISLQTSADGGSAGGDTESDLDVPSVEARPRLQLLDFSSLSGGAVTPSVPAYQVSPGLSNVVNLNQFYLSDAVTSKLEENLFVVTGSYGNEFFELYEDNRYYQLPNFVTVDSLMHTYHLYFSLLLNRTEKNHLFDALKSLTFSMLDASQRQYDALRGTGWEEAAARNVAYFAVGAKLLDGTAAVPEYAAEMVETELGRIMETSGNPVLSTVALDYMDYSQYIPRGYYAGDPVLEAYFRAMMWYGQVNFSQTAEDAADPDTLTRSALLMTLAMDADSAAWEQIYAVTSFFAGTSDDLGYYEYAPAIEAAYGSMPDVSALPEDEDSFAVFKAILAKMDPPAINSVPVWDADLQPGTVDDILASKKGFRFMGQRFTLDAAIMQRLVYRAVEERSDGSRRMLPDALDVPAALGSDKALELLDEMGATSYPKYSENMETLRACVADAPEATWSASLYSSWLYTLMPLLETKGEGYPSYMCSGEWQKKALETFAGSYTELKHDTVLYSKQVVAEMGGGPTEIIDDRGYVDPEVEVYARFALLAQQTAEGLDQLGFLSDADRENLSRLAQLAELLRTISEKELRNETLTDEEYELIRGYGGTLEHFWIEAVKDKAEAEYFDAQEIPSSLVTDIATDPNGTVLQVANGRPAEILVVVPVDGTLRLASGAVYDFYQFTHPSADRLTDEAWRQMIGQWFTADSYYNWDSQVEKPQWTTSYWCVE